MDIINKLANSPLYISIKEIGAKKHTPYSFRNGYTNLLGVTRYSYDKLDKLKDSIRKSVNESDILESMQIVDIKTKKVIFKYSKN